MNGMRTLPRGDQPHQEQLFATPQQPVCPHCSATARNLCSHDASISRGLTEPLARRPKHCIASAQLSPDQPLPF